MKMHEIKQLNEELRQIRKFGRIGTVGGKKCLFTHRDPVSGEYWSDDLFDGKWIDASKIQWA